MTREKKIHTIVKPIHSSLRSEFESIKHKCLKKSGGYNFIWKQW